MEIALQPSARPTEQPSSDNSIPVVYQEIEDQDETETGPTKRTRAKTSTSSITQEVLLQMADILSMSNAITARSAASRKFSL